MESDFLKKYYRLERTHWWFIIREKIIREQIRKSLPGKGEREILNVGAATGKTTEMLQDFGRVTSVEFDAATCEFLRAELGINVTEASVTALPFPDNTFDVICAFDVLEHIEDDQRAILELKRVCRPGGCIYITVPAFAFLWSRHDRVNHHRRRYSVKGITGLVSTAFRVEYRSFFNFILFFPIATYRLLQKVLPSPAALHSDFEGNTLLSNKSLGFCCKRIFQLEVYWLRVFRFPLGVSILLRGRKL